jgi:hypothetical protein
MARPQEVVDPRGAVVQRVPRLGDMRWDGEVWRRWNGRRWIKAVYAFRPERLRNPARFAAEETVTQERRDKALALAVEDQVLQNGATVVHEGPTGVVLAYRQRPSTGGHVLLTLLTAGLWTPVLLVALNRRNEHRVRLEADSHGNVWATPVASA